jgi:outer membrane protein insertion porin family
LSAEAKSCERGLDAISFFWLTLTLILFCGLAVPSELGAWQDTRDDKATGDKAAPTPGASPQGEKPARENQKPADQKPAEQKPQKPAEKAEPQKPSNQPAPSQPQLQLEAPQVAPATPEKKPQAPQPAAPAPVQPPQQAVVAEIHFRGNHRIPSATLRARIFSHDGDVYDENALERDFMALWNTGFLDDIRLEVTDGKAGKIVTFFVREKKLVRSIDYKGLSSVQTSDVLDRFKERKVGLSIQSQFDPVVIKRAEVVLQQLLAEHGRQFASVHARTRNIPPNSVALVFIVVEGPKVKVGNVRFQGNTVFSNHALVRAMKYSKPLGAPPWFYWFHRTYDKDKVDYDLEQVRSLYQDHGYFTALVPKREPTLKMTDTRHHAPFFFWSWGKGKQVDLTIPVEEGPQYRLGKFVIRGNKLFKQEVLAPVLQMKSGDIFNLSKVRKALENYKKLYGQFGYINFVATPDPERDDKRRLVNLALDFEEEKQFFVHRIEFSGNTKTRDKVIRRELLLYEGELFNTTRWDYSVLKVNQLAFFDPIKKEDYDIKQNEKEGTVDINVKVKEKGRNSIGFSGGVSGIAGNFVGLNYATNNFLGLGETLSVEAQFGTFERLYSFGFTEPYLFDRPITTGFTVFKSDYHFDQLRQTAVAEGLNPFTLQQAGLGGLFQNFQQNSSGFTAFASYPLRRTFARVGLSYSFSVSSVLTFNAATQGLFQALTFGQFQGPSQLSGITSSQVTPTFLYNTLNGGYNATAGKYLSLGLSFSGGPLGGNVNTIRPVIEAKYLRPINHRRNTLAFHFLGETISGFGGRVPPPFSRIYMGGEYDIRGYDIYTLSPVGFFPTIGQVCNRDSQGNPIPSVGPNGQRSGCGSFTRFPYNTIQFPGGDTELLTNIEYRIPIVGPVTLAPFIDAGMPFIWRTSQLKLQNGPGTSLNQIATQFPYFASDIPNYLKPIGVTNIRPRSSAGLELQVVLPVVNAPFRVFYGYNWLRVDNILTPPQVLPPRSLFPNQATYNDVLRFFQPFPFRDRKARLGFTVARQF